MGHSPSLPSARTTHAVAYCVAITILCHRSRTVHYTPRTANCPLYSPPSLLLSVAFVHRYGCLSGILLYGTARYLYRYSPVFLLVFLYIPMAASGAPPSTARNIHACAARWLVVYIALCVCGFGRPADALIPRSHPGVAPVPHLRPPSIALAPCAALLPAKSIGRVKILLN